MFGLGQSTFEPLGVVGMNPASAGYRDTYSVTVGRFSAGTASKD